MINVAIDRVDAFATRHARVIGIVSVGLFALSCAVTARFVRLPDVVPFSDRTMTLLTGAWNAIWWGFLYPHVKKRRASRTTIETSRG